MQSNFMILLCVIIPFEYGAQAEDACQEIQKLNGRPKAVFASKGFLYAQVSGNLYACSLNKKPAVWKRMDLPDLMDLRTNGSGELFARSTDPPESPFGAIPGTEGKPKQMFFHKVKGYLVQELARYSKVDTRDWYVDATGRIWFQGADLIVIPIGKEPRVIKSRPSNYGHRVQQPCEWKPGHVILFYNTSMVVGTPSQVTVHRPPRFAEDGTGSGPLRLGTELLVSGGRNNPGRGSYLMDARAPETKPIRIGLGWDWFHPVASAPDGRALVRAQTDRNPQYTLFWYAPDGQSQVRLEGAGAVLRSGLGSRVLFDDAGRGFMRLKDGTLAIFEEKRARVVTRS
ncbi:MAG: hypothetical protein QF473_27845, partial [Planctomycetota bacterium]|nr:hypothetical protein [Planctomycetota bacterium]